MDIPFASSPAQLCVEDCNIALLWMLNVKYLYRSIFFLNPIPGIFWCDKCNYDENKLSERTRIVIWEGQVSFNTGEWHYPVSGTLKSTIAGHQEEIDD